jgi:(1->4)-alpha-D-glucan 1-alpha-D-glucosylmutase
MRERMKAYLVKALREAKLETSWLEPNEDYERACLAFLEGLLDRGRSAPFIGDVTAFLREIAPYAMQNSLAQTVLKLTAPGIPDIYQGTELWDLSLVDPDNRRPVDFARRREMLRVGPKSWTEMQTRWQDGQIKLHVIARILALRREMPDLFAQGSYEPLAVAGQAAGHAFAYRRRLGDRAVIVVLGRLFTRLATGKDRASTRIVLPRNAPAAYRDVLTGAQIEATRNRLALDRLFGALPVAVLADRA